MKENIKERWFIDFLFLFGSVEDKQQDPSYGGHGHKYFNELRYGKLRWGHRLGDETKEETVKDVDSEIKGTIQFPFMHDFVRGRVSVFWGAVYRQPT